MVTFSPIWSSVTHNGKFAFGRIKYGVYTCLCNLPIDMCNADDLVFELREKVWFLLVYAIKCILNIFNTLNDNQTTTSFAKFGGIKKV